MRSSATIGGMALRLASTASTRSDIARRMRNQAGDAEKDHPGMQVHGHLRDAAKQLERGNTEGAQRHLRSAMQSLTPLQLVRHGHLNDDEHQGGKEHMAQLTRHLLQIKDVEDTEQRNDQYRQNRAAMNAPAGNPIGPPSGTANGPSAQISEAGKPVPARDWRAAGQQSAGPSLIGGSKHMSNVDLSWRDAWRTEARGSGGQWTGVSADLVDQVRSEHGSEAADHLKAGRFSKADEIIVGHIRQTPSGAAKEHAQALLLRVRQEAKRAANAVGNYQGMGLESMIAEGKPTSHMLANNIIEARRRGQQIIELSAQTARLASTPRPYGKPGGPGLYHVKGLKHSDYLENIVHALMTKRGMDKGKATAIARGAIRKWMRGGGNVHPEVRAAAGKAEAEELKAQAQAKMHSNISQRELLMFNPNHGPGGRFASAPGSSGGQKPSGSKAHQRQVLTRKIAGLRSQIANLESQLRASRSGRSRSSTPRKTGAGATSAKQAAAAKASAKSPSSTAASSTKYKSPNQLRTQIAVLRAQLRADVAQLRHL